MLQSKFKELYNYCQNVDPKISRRLIQKKIEELFDGDRQKFAFAKVKIDPTIVRAFIKVKTVMDESGVPYNLNRICFSDELNYCWERFVCVKEMMHLFDSDNEKTSNKEQFEKLLSDLSTPTESRSNQANSDIRAFWMTIACLCPEKHRQEFAAKREAQEIDDYAIALKLKIPQQYVPSLFTDSYTTLVDALLK